MKALFATLVGSKLYGISTETSDTDIKGIALGEISQLIGLENFEQQEFKNDVEDGPSKIEGVLYAVDKYLNLCFKGNPTVIEIAFADPKYHLYSTPIGEEVCDFVRKHMLTKHLFKPYSAYHMAQMRKLQSQERVGKRQKIVEEHNFDPKFAGHSYRLARQCVIVMREGVLRPTLDPEDREICLKIRQGKKYFTKESVLELLKSVDTEMYDAYKTSTLKESPDFKLINNFVIDIHLRYIKGEFDNQFKVPFVFPT